jgi:mitochondrial chaperone BCS1
MLLFILTAAATQAALSHPSIDSMASNLNGNSSSIPLNPQTVLLDTFFPGFSLLSAALLKYLKIDVTHYLPALVAIGIMIFTSQYASNYLWDKMENYFMSTADIRVDDEMYNMFMSWVANQKFSKSARRFVPNTNVNSRNWLLWHFNRNDEDSEYDDEPLESNDLSSVGKKKKKPLQYTPSFGMHYFWYKGQLLLFKRTQAQQQQSFMPVSEREEISVSSFGRNPKVLKELLDECRADFMKNDENRTLIYRGSVKPGTTEPVWTRCMSRISRPFSTVVLDESVKKDLLEDMQDYLHPLTRRWYGNRGIPYRRGYLLYGPPGTGKSSLSFAVAGYFKLKIYIVSLNSSAMNEENLGTLFADLPKKCVVLLEDIDTAGLTHTRQAPKDLEEEAKPAATNPATQTAVNTTRTSLNKISLSALLNVIDGVASQEGRVLIMTTNHVEKLDEALIRPGRVDMKVKFDLADPAMIKTLFKGIFATLEGDFPKSIADKAKNALKTEKSSTVTKEMTKESVSLEVDEELAQEVAAKKQVEEARISALADDFAALIPSHTFSPAEIQGFLLKNKRSAAAAVSGAEQWVKDTLAQKEKKAKEAKAKEEEEAKKAEEAAKKAKEEEEAKKAKEEAAEKKEEKTDKPMVNGVKESLANGIEKGTMTNGIDKETMTNGIEKEHLTNGI